jgi:CheY-like chemotaxis protein
MSRVLLVDDDPDQLEVRRMLFQQAGHEVYTAVDPETALEVFARAAPRLVITDLRLPRTEDGLALIQALRDRAPEVRIVVLSGWTADLDQLPTPGLVDAVFGKPARTGRLLALAAKLALWIFAALVCLAPRAGAAVEGEKFGNPMPDAGLCCVGQAGKAFFLDKDYQPGESFFKMLKPIDIPTGEMIELPVR